MPSAGPGESVDSVHCEVGHQPCHHGRQCVAVSGLCDGRYDCWDRSDEMHCGKCNIMGGGGGGQVRRNALW